MVNGEELDNEATNDISPEEWLAEDDTNITGRVKLRNGRTMLVAAITQDELVAMRKLSQRAGLDPQNPKKIKVDSELLARRILCHAINKANGKNDLEGVQPAQLGKKITGDLISIQKQILSLSGLDEESVQPNTEDFLG